MPFKLTRTEGQLDLSTSLSEQEIKNLRPGMRVKYKVGVSIYKVRRTPLITPKGEVVISLQSETSGTEYLDTAEKLIRKSSGVVPADAETASRLGRVTLDHTVLTGSGSAYELYNLVGPVYGDEKITIGA